MVVYEQCFFWCTQKSAVSCGSKAVLVAILRQLSCFNAAVFESRRVAHHKCVRVCARGAFSCGTKCLLPHARRLCALAEERNCGLLPRVC